MLQVGVVPVGGLVQSAAVQQPFVGMQIVIPGQLL
jgi:hypothetical protein